MAEQKVAKKPKAVELYPRVHNDYSNDNKACILNDSSIWG